MATKADIRTGVKTKLTREPAGINTKIDEYIDMAVELFGNTLTSVHDDREYDYTVIQGDVDSNVETYDLPARLKVIWNVVWVDTTGSEDTFYKIQIVSPSDIYNAKVHGLQGDSGSSVPAGGRFDLGTDANTFIQSGSRFGRATRVNQTGRIKMVSRIADKLYAFPRPGDAEVGMKLRLFAGFRPELLSTDGSENTITNNYPEALESYVAALTEYYVFKNYPAGDKWLQQASLMLTNFASQDEINQLMNIPLSFSRG